MKLQFKKAALATAIALLGTGAAQASIIGVNDPAGSELLLNIVNTVNNASVNLDLGVQGASTSSYALPTDITTFISNAGLANIQFSVTNGNSNTFDFVTTSALATFSSLNLGNGTKSSWNGSINTLINTLNGGDPTATSVNNPYGGTGGFTGATTPNYKGGNHYRWGIVNNNLNNLGNAVDGNLNALPLNLYLVDFNQSSSLGNAAITQIGTATLTGDTLQLNVVPVPAAVWLFGSALGLLGISRRKSA